MFFRPVEYADIRFDIYPIYQIPHHNGYRRKKTGKLVIDEQRKEIFEISMNLGYLKRSPKIS